MAEDSSTNSKNILKASMNLAELDAKSMLLAENFSNRSLFVGVVVNTMMMVLLQMTDEKSEHGLKFSNITDEDYAKGAQAFHRLMQETGANSVGDLEKAIDEHPELGDSLKIGTMVKYHIASVMFRIFDAEDMNDLDELVSTKLHKWHKGEFDGIVDWKAE